MTETDNNAGNSLLDSKGRFPADALMDVTQFINKADRDQVILNRANDLVAENYHTFTDKDTISVDAVRERVVFDRFLENGQAVPIFTGIRNPATTALEFAATVRYVSGRDTSGSALAPIEAMEVVEADTWPFIEQGYSGDQIGEMSRFAVAKPYRNISGKLLVGMTRRAFAIAIEEQKKELYIVAPQTMVDFYVAGGIIPEKVPSRLRLDDPRAVEVYDVFHKYWKNEQKPPQLYRFSEQVIYANALPGTSL